jgi:hypothetical protein
MPLLLGDVGIEILVGALDAAAGTARELPRRRRRASHDRRDVVEGQVEHIVQDERDPLGRRERLKHHQQRETDRVRHLNFLLGIESALAPHDRFRHVGAHGILAARLAPAQHIEAHARDDRGQPSAEIADLAGVGTGKPQPGLLDRVVGLGQRPEHPVGDPS